MNFGTVGFRASSEVKYLPKWTAKKVLAKLKELGRVEFIKTTESVKKAEIKSSGLDDKVLAGFGCCIQSKDTFFFEPDRSAIANAKKKLEVVRKAS